MIAGVKIKNLVIHQDVPDLEQPDVKPGILMEVLRADEGLLGRFGQSTVTVTYSGTIKGFHWHERQEDLWFAATGRVAIVLHDLRSESPTFGQTEVLYAGQDDYKLIVIPPGVAHGYKVISAEPVLLFYHTNETYDPKNPDEQRLPWNDPKINFDWGKV